ncbi:hypothetical protein CPLU01_04411 [Colletotrichum plurivorum]|uniref:Uncharacterized protein n=1 Tax=Colletotrichum plurivorum TaxID=2175906 RepID=A0A8H6KQY3_9PEZI|nr:hypothetical protein CPLU01_04411 [Colletotrichum plurivorum]
MINHVPDPQTIRREGRRVDTRKRSFLVEELMRPQAAAPLDCIEAMSLSDGGPLTAQTGSFSERNLRVGINDDKPRSQLFASCVCKSQNPASATGWRSVVSTLSTNDIDRRVQLPSMWILAHPAGGGGSSSLWVAITMDETHSLSAEAGPPGRRNTSPQKSSTQGRAPLHRFAGCRHGITRNAHMRVEAGPGGDLQETGPFSGDTLSTAGRPTVYGPRGHLGIDSEDRRGRSKVGFPWNETTIPSAVYAPSRPHDRRPAVYE